MNLETTFRSHKPERCARSAICVAVLLASAVFSGEAEAVRRSCRATGEFVFAFSEEVSGSVVAQRTESVNILQSDMEVVASGYQQGGRVRDIKRAKKFACSEATRCFLAQASGADGCAGHYYGTIFETITRPPNINHWRRQVACNHARAGNVPGVRRTGSNTVKLVKTDVWATASRDSVTDRRYQPVNEHGHVCWKPRPSVPGGVDPIPGVLDPEPRPKPPRPPSNDLKVPFQVTGGSIEVTPSLHNGACPTQIEAEASLTVVGQGTVRFRLNHKGGRGPIRTVTFRQGGTKTSTATYTIGDSGGGAGPTEGMVTQGGSGGGGSGGFQQNTAPNEHTGWFEIEIVSPRSPFKKSAPAHYKVVCKPTPAMEPVEAQLVPGIGGAPDLVLLSAAPGRDGACRLVVGNAGKQRSAKTVVRLSARGQKPIDLDLPPIPPGGRRAVPVKSLGDLRWRVHLDRSNAVRESDEDNNRAWVRGCRPLGKR